MARTPITQARTGLTEDRHVRRVSGSVQFVGDGTQTSAKSETSDIMSSYNKVCIEMYVRNVINSNSNTIMECSNGWSFRDDGFIIFWRGTGGTIWGSMINSTAGTSTIMQINVPKNEWVLLHVVFDRTKTGADAVTMYANGVEGSAPVGSPDGTFTGNFSSEGLYFGSRAFGAVNSGQNALGRTRIFSFDGEFDTTLPAKMVVNPNDYGDMTLEHDWAFLEGSGTTVENLADTSGDYDLELKSGNEWGAKIEERPFAVRESGTVHFDTPSSPATPATVETDGLLANVDKLCINFWLRRVSSVTDNHAMSGSQNTNFRMGAWEIYFPFVSNDRLEVLMQDWDTTTLAREIVRTNDPLPKGWNFITVVFDRAIEAGSGACSIFVNGIKDDSITSQIVGNFSSGFADEIYFGAYTATAQRVSDVYIGATRFFEFTGSFDESLPRRMMINPTDTGDMTLISEWTMYDPASPTVAENSVDSDYDLLLGSDGTFGEDLFRPRREIT